MLRRLKNDAKAKEDVTKSKGTISFRFEALGKELASTKTAAQKAQGKHLVRTLH
jgi:hypothetical protein